MTISDKTQQARVSFGRKLKELRGWRGWSLEELAENAGIQADALAQIERGETTTRLEDMRRLAGAFGVSMTALVGLEREAGDG